MTDLGMTDFFFDIIFADFQISRLSDFQMPPVPPVAKALDGVWPVGHGCSVLC